MPLYCTMVNACERIGSCPIPWYRPQTWGRNDEYRRNETRSSDASFSVAATGNSWAKEPESSVRWDPPKTGLLFWAFFETVSVFLKSAEVRLQQPKYPLRIQCAHARRA
jgi:hypothetical protein